MAEKDYYKTLGVSKDATKQEIKKAFKKKALKFHPDRAPEDKKKEYEEKFKEINEAVSILGDEKKRAQYDQFGSAAFNGAGAGGYSQQGFDFSDIMSQFRGGAFGDFDDVFDSLFGGARSGRRSRSGARRGSDLRYDISLSLEEAATGLKRSLTLRKLEHCESCEGKGGTNWSSCTDCNGQGHVRRTQRTPFGVFQQDMPCPSCQGAGQVPQNICSSCSGQGLERKQKTIEVTIPAGVEHGTRLRLSGEGEAGAKGGPHGDLYVVVSIPRHKYFEREGNDLVIEIPISFTQAVLGDSIEVPTITGKADLKIPAGTDSETIFRMKGKGMPSLRGSGSGDQYVKVTIQVPKKVSRKQKDLLEKLKEEKPSKGFLKRFFGK